MSGLPIQGPGAGFGLANLEYLMICTSAMSVGEVVAVDTSTITNGKFTTVDTAAATDEEAELIGVAVEEVAAGGTGRIVFRGTVNVLTSGTPAAGAKLAVGAGVLLASNANAKVVGYALEAGVASTPTSVLFDGVSGFGNDNA